MALCFPYRSFFFDSIKPNSGITFGIKIFFFVGTIFCEATVFLTTIERGLQAPGANHKQNIRNAYVQLFSKKMLPI